jgi:hypothetical protein
MYGYVEEQLDALIPSFGLQHLRAQIMHGYAEVCRRSLAYSFGQRPAMFSRINYDGTPFQFGVTLRPGSRTLQFLGEVGEPGLSSAERIRLNRVCIRRLAGVTHAGAALAALENLLDAMAPPTDQLLLADPAGAFWIGMGFASAARQPQVRVYINAKWGGEPDRWARLRHFAAYFDSAESWRRLEDRLAPDLQPLGTAVTLDGEQPPSGRIYLSAYGKRLTFYADLARQVADDSLAQTVLAFAECLLGADSAYPTQTSVCSFGVTNGPVGDFKVELCAHCLYASDAAAASHLKSWCIAAGISPADYDDVLRLISGDEVSQMKTEVHSYVGVGQRQGTPYTTLYLKPRVAAPNER